MLTNTSSGSLEIRPLSDSEAAAVLEVYRQCEDFLALGPVSSASPEMVLEDMEHSHREGSLFCGIYAPEGRMIGVVDYLPSGYRGDPQLACLYLLMIAASFRSQGIGAAVVAVVEKAIGANPEVAAILAGVQVNNPRAVRFWLKRGYRITGGPDLMPDRTIVFSLRKDLGEQPGGAPGARR